MMLELLLGATLAVLSPGAGEGRPQDGPAPCELTDGELASQALGASRLQRIGDMTLFEATAADAVGGCGVWVMHVNADGSVGDAEMLRGEPSGAYSRVIPAWLETFRFHPQGEAWTSTTLVAITASSSSEAEAPAE